MERSERSAYEAYASEYNRWVRSLTQDAAAGNLSAKEELEQLTELGLLEPLPYEGGSSSENDDEEFDDPADRAVVQIRSDYRKPIVDFDEVDQSELDSLCDHFGAALNWATTGKPDLLVMGARWIAILSVMRPQLVGGMRLISTKSWEFKLRATLMDRDPLVTGEFFRRPLGWVRDCKSLSQLGQRGYSLIYVMRNDLAGGITCEEIGGMKNDTRQAANKPINSFRDTFSGIQSLNMRGENTRTKCRIAQR